MATLLEWFNRLSNGEKIEAVVFGEMEFFGSFVDSPNIGRLLTSDEAMPYLVREFDNDFGAPGCPPVVIYTKTWIISVYQYDGSTGPFRIPRNPTEGFRPDMPGG